MPLKKVSEEIRFSPDKMTKVNLFESERFFCDVHCLRPGQEHRSHVHAGEDKVYYVVKGTVVFRDGNADVAGVVGDALWAPAGVEHGVRNEGAEDAAILVFMAPHPRGNTFG